MRRCDLCGSKLDIFTTIHKTHKFIDNNNYDRLCFTCYNVPKIIHQSYDNDGDLKDEVVLEYSCEHTYSAKELVRMGAADNINQAANSIRAVHDSCKKLKKTFSQKDRPRATWILG
jgi:hypothetical protein